MKRTSKPATLLQSTVKIYDNFTFPRKPLREFSPMPTLSAQTIEINRMYKRISQKQMNERKNHLFCTTDLQEHHF
jgi:hypothetical protein